MSTKKVIAGSFGAIIVLVAAQLLAQLAAGLFAAINVPAGICNIAAGIIYALLALYLLRLLSEKLLGIKTAFLGMPAFSIRGKWLAVGFLLPAAVIAVYLLCLSGELVSSGMDGGQIFSTLSAGIAFTGIAAGFVEEMVFRGVIMNLMKDRWGVGAAVLVPSILFGAVHIIGADLSAISGLMVILSGTMAGIMFSMIALESGSVWNSGIVHSLWNIMIIGGGLTIGAKADEYSVMTYVLESDNFIFTGGEFGIEASVIALSGYIIVTLAAACMIRKNGSRKIHEPI